MPADVYFHYSNARSVLINRSCTAADDSNRLVNTPQISLVQSLITSPVEDWSG
jgi:hypothetical protein